MTEIPNSSAIGHAPPSPKSDYILVYYVLYYVFVKTMVNLHLISAKLFPTHSMYLTGIKLKGRGGHNFRIKVISDSFRVLDLV